MRRAHARPVRRYARPLAVWLAAAGCAVGLVGLAPVAAAATYSLQVSLAADRSAPAALDGASLDGNAYIFLTPASGVRRVDFYLDDPQRAGAPIHTETTAPLDFAGGSAAAASPLDTTSLAAGTHTVTAAVTPSTGSGSVLAATFNTGAAAAGPRVSVSSPDDAPLGLPGHRLVFSTVRSAATDGKVVTFRNTGSSPLTVSQLTVQGADASSFSLQQNGPLDIAPGGSAQVALLFTPTAPTGCPTTADPNAVSDPERYASLTWSSNDSRAGTGTVDLAGLNSCNVEGGNEPVLGQMFRALGFTTRANSGTADARFLGSRRTPSSDDEFAVPYFVAADPSQPVSLIPLAHYGGRTVNASGFGATGWYQQGDPVRTPCTRTLGCRELWRFAGDTSTSYTDNQKLLPLPGAQTTFSPNGPFGVWQGDGYGINFADDGKNVALTPANAAISPPHYLHSLRVFRAYGAGRARLAHTWLVAVDITRVPSYKNNDFQDVVFEVRNADPAVVSGPQPAAPALIRSLGSAGPVAPSCTMAGFDGALPDTAGDQCDPSALHSTAAGLQVTASAGQLGGAGGAQKNALYNTFDASRRSFTASTRVLGPIGYLAEDYQQVAAWFGPDQDNYVKVEAEHNGTTSPRLTMFFEEGGHGSTVQSVSVPGLTTASTLDLTISGNTSVPDPTPSTADPNRVRNYPLDELTVSYSLDGAAAVPLGNAVRPADVTGWFSTAARAGVLASGGGSTSPFTATFASVSIR